MSERSRWQAVSVLTAVLGAVALFGGQARAGEPEAPPPNLIVPYVPSPMGVVEAMTRRNSA